MFSKIRFTSPSLVIAVIALFISLTGTAVAAGIVPKARLALNSLKLQGKTARQVAALAPARPPSSVAGLVTVKTASWSLGPSQGSDFSISCDSGQKAIAGGYDNPTGVALAFDTRPSSDGGSWKIYLSGGTSGGSGTLFAVCLK